MAGKRNRITTTTTTNLEDRRIGAEGGSTIVSEGGALTNNFSDNRSFADNRSETTNLIDSDTALQSVEALEALSRDAVSGAHDTARGFFDGVGGITDRAFDSVGGITGRAFDATEATSLEAISSSSGLADRLFSSAGGIVDRALDLSEAAGARQQATVSEALAKTASEGNQALELVVRGAMVIAAAFFVAQVLR